MINDKWKIQGGFTLIRTRLRRNLITVQHGFTLIELLVVISIIGILATLITANLNAARSRARDAERKSDMRNTATALRLYFNDYGNYPKNGGTFNILGCGGLGTAACAGGVIWAAGAGPTTYMSILPKDPLSSQSYRYTYVNSDTYVLQACLENKSDTNGIVTDTGWCPSGWMFQIQP